MSIKKNFKQQFRLSNFLLEHDAASDFYITCFQRSQSTSPLLIVRTLICLGCLSIWLASIILTTQHMPIKFWPIYMTHWGLVLNTIAAGSGVLVSVMTSIKLPTDTDSVLPWHVRVYWVVFNIATTIAFFITVFYWTLLSGVGSDQQYAINLTLDIFIHAVNSVLMGALLIISCHPVYYLHLYMPVGLAVVYLVFSYIYFSCGGTDAYGSHAIYPMLDWEKPGETMGIVVFCMIGIAILHGVIVALAVGRDALSRRFKKNTTAYNIYEVY